MKWNKAAQVLAVVAVASMTITGCSSGDNGGESDANGGVTTLKFAATTFAESGRGPLLEAWLDGFNSSQDKIKVEPASIPYPTFGSTILTQMGGGVGPDLIRFDMPEYSAAAAAGLLEPLNDRIDESDYDFIKGPDKFGVVDGKRYGVMFEITNYALIYNTELVQTPPTTFDEFLDTAKGATKDGVFGYAFRQTMPEEGGMFQDLFNYIYGFGGALSNGKELTLNSPGTIKGVEAFKAMYDANVIPKGATASTYRTMFGDKKVAMEIDNGAVPGIFRGMNPDIQLNAAPIPFPEEAHGAILAPIVINAASKYKDAATTFLKWMLEPENQASLQALQGASSVATVTERSADDLANMPYLSVFDGLTETGLPHIVVGFEAKTPEIRKILIEQTLSALQGQQSVEEAMNKAQELATAAVGG